MSISTPYVKLTTSPFSGRGCLFGVPGLTRVFAGDDHLLIANSTILKEMYKRIYFKDIQLIHLQVTRLALYLNVLCTLLVVVFGMLEAGNGVPFGFSGFFLILVLLYLLINIFKGTTCICKIQTGVQTFVLPVGRLKAANRVLDIIGQKAYDAQGAFPEEGEASQGVSVGARRTLQKHEHPPSIPRVRRHVVMEPYSGYWHAWLAVSWLVYALIMSLVKLTQNSAILYLGLLCFFVSGVLNIFIVFKQRKRKLRGIVVYSSSLAAIVWVVQAMICYGHFMWYSLVSSLNRIDYGFNYLQFMDSVSKGLSNMQYLVPILLFSSTAVGIYILYGWARYCNGLQQERTET
ncbi:MAG: hypothetical protein CR997_06685 [Acidobacteria bacterium]|nr:MAG: hypothetical protein CR997_06685 [Acidobacteriota bacterium]